MWQYLSPPTSNELSHHGILGMKWGVRRYQNKDGTLTAAGKKRYEVKYWEESNKTIKTNRDGSKTIPSGFVFNRVGKSSMDVNQSGALYVSYGKEDAARYIKTLGPTPLGKLLGTASETVQHIRTKENLKMPSDSETAKETAKLLLADKKLFETFKESFYSLAFTGNFNKEVSTNDLKNALKNPSGKDGQKLAYAVSSFLGDGNYASESKVVYQHFRTKGYDVIPDLHDTLSGTSKTGMIVINPNKVKITSTTTITKDIMKAGKKYVKSLEKLKVSELIE